MDYMKMYQEAKAAGKIQRQTYRIHTWDTVGDVLIGKVMGLNDFTGGKFETPVKAYLLDTELGFISTILGSATDEQLSAVDLPGKIICITYQGKKELTDGRSVNLFDVDVVDEYEELLEPETPPKRRAVKNGK